MEPLVTSTDPTEAVARLISDPMALLDTLTQKIKNTTMERLQKTSKKHLNKDAFLLLRLLFEQFSPNETIENFLRHDSVMRRRELYQPVFRVIYRMSNPLTPKEKLLSRCEQPFRNLPKCRWLGHQIPLDGTYVDVKEVDDAQLKDVAEGQSQRSRMGILLGESGSGKTTRMLACAQGDNVFGVYLVSEGIGHDLASNHGLAAAFSRAEKESSRTQKKEVARDFESAEKHRERRDKAVHDGVVEAVVKAVQTALEYDNSGKLEDLQQQLPGKANGRLDLEVVVAVDELGVRLGAARGLIADYKRIRVTLCKVFRSVVVLGAGTGLELVASTLGSNPDHYWIFFVKPTTCDFAVQLMLKHPKFPQWPLDQCLSYSKRVVEWLQQHPGCKLLMQNARSCSFLIDSFWKDIPEVFVLHPSQEVIARVAPTLAILASYKYSRVNGLKLLRFSEAVPIEHSSQSVSTLTVDTMTARVLNAVMLHKFDNRATLPDDLEELLRLGFITDMAKIVNKRPNNSRLLCAMSATSSLILEETTLGRFHVTGAMLYILHTCFGGVNDLMDSWEGFEERVALFIRAFLRSYAVRTDEEYAVKCVPAEKSWTLGHFLFHLSSEHYSLEILKSHLGDFHHLPQVLDQALGFVGVRWFRSPGRMEARWSEGGKSQAHWPSQEFQAAVAEALKANHAVVILNGGQAAFADVIILLPGQAVVLIQCKYYQSSTSFSLTDAMVELCKMGAGDFTVNGVKARVYGLAERFTSKALKQMASEANIDPSRPKHELVQKLEARGHVPDRVDPGASCYDGGAMANELKELTKAELMVPVLVTVSHKVDFGGLGVPMKNEWLPPLQLQAGEECKGLYPFVEWTLHRVGAPVKTKQITRQPAEKLAVTPQGGAEGGPSSVEGSRLLPRAAGPGGVGGGTEGGRTVKRRKTG